MERFNFYQLLSHDSEHGAVKLSIMKVVTVHMAEIKQVKQN